MHTLTNQHDTLEQKLTNNGCPANCLQIFKEHTGMATIGIGRIDALCRKVVQLLEIGVHHNLLLVCVLEGLGPQNLGRLNS